MPTCTLIYKDFFYGGVKTLEHRQNEGNKEVDALYIFSPDRMREIKRLMPYIYLAQTE